MLSLVFEFSVGIGGFVIGLGQISFFFTLACFGTFGASLLIFLNHFVCLRITDEVSTRNAHMTHIAYSIRFKMVSTSY